MNYDVGVITQPLRISPDGSFALSTGGTAPGGGAWYTLVDLTSVLTTDSNGWEQYCVAQYIAPAAYDAGAPATGTQLRVTIRTASTVGAAFSSSYLGHSASSGDVIDFDGTQASMLWSGSATGTVGAATTRTCDAVTYAFNKTKGLVLRMRFYGPSNIVSSGAAGGSANYQRSFALELAGSDVFSGQTNVTVDGSVFDFMANGGYLFTKVEVFG